MNEFRWALIGPGRIAHRFADAVHRMPGTRLAIVHGRDAERAASFAAQWDRDGAPRIHVAADLGELLRSDDVDAVYVATPHAFHAGAVRRCLEADKPVLCEKPLVANRASAEELVGISRARGVFLMEAVWTRFLPVYAAVQDWLRSQAIGRLQAIQSTFCFNLPFDAKGRHFDPSQAGGALLDIGVYNLTMTRWALAAAHGRCPPMHAMQAQAVIGPTGVDHRVSVALEFPDGVASQFICGFDGAADNGLRILGEHGHISVPARFWEATEASLHRPGESPVPVHRPFRINGFEGEIEEAIRCVRSGAIESAVIPHEETLATLAWMDEIRNRIGVRYPFE
jgi:predicted dehydrogenase